METIQVRSKFRKAKTLLLVLSIVCLSGTTGYLGAYIQRKTANEETSKVSETSLKVISSESELISELSKKVGQSVVSINVAVSDSFGFVTEEGAGTGVIISTNGVVITNRHVIPVGTSKVSITLADGTELNDVEIIGRTASNDPLDIAFLKINDTKGKTLQAATVGDSAKVSVGDKVVAIGNALGYFQNTVTSGIISGYGRDVEASDSDGGNVETLQNLFQTDAAINPGNSGGPLVNLDGEVIGINVATASDAQSIGFSIPINDVKGLIASVEKNGRLVRPYLGVRYIPLSDTVAYQYNLDIKRGAYIPVSQSGSVSVVSGGPADKAGIREGDVITEINNIAINEKTSLVSALGKFNVGDKVTVTVYRNGKYSDLEATLQAAP